MAAKCPQMFSNALSPSLAAAPPWCSDLPPCWCYNCFIALLLFHHRRHRWVVSLPYCCPKFLGSRFNLPSLRHLNQNLQARTDHNSGSIFLLIFSLPHHPTHDHLIEDNSGLESWIHMIMKLDCPHCPLKLSVWRKPELWTSLKQSRDFC